MRNAKYRGFAVTRNILCWVYGDKEEKKDGTVIGIRSEGCDKSIPIVSASLGVSITSIAALEDGQPLVDKNGEEIFEGDVVKKGNERLLIGWNGKALRFDFYTKNGDIVAGCNPETLRLCEVLGAYYLSPQLLDKESETHG